MDDSADRIWSDLDEALRDSLEAKDIAVLAGLFAAWHILASDSGFPDSARPPPLSDALPRDQIETAFGDIVANSSSDLVASALGQESRIPFERLSEVILARSSNLFTDFADLSVTDREAFATILVDRLSTTRSAPGTSVPVEIAQVMARLLMLDPGATVFCPAPSADTLAIACLKENLCPVIESHRPPVLASLYAIITGSELEIVPEDPYRSDLSTQPPPTTFDYGLIVPPWGQKQSPFGTSGPISGRHSTSQSEVLGIDLALQRIRSSAVIAVPTSLLFSSGHGRHVREQLVNDELLAAVIHFPGGVLPKTGIAMSLLLLSIDRRTSKISLAELDRSYLTESSRVRAHRRRPVEIDAILDLVRHPDGKHAVSVTTNQIRQTSYNLAPSRYLSGPEVLEERLSPCLPLGELADVVKPQALKADEGPDGVPIQEALPGDMPAAGYLQRVERKRLVSRRSLMSRKKQILRDGDVLVSTKGTIGTVGVASPDPDSQEPLLSSQASVILRIRRGHDLDPRYLAMYLKSPQVQKVLSSLATRGTVANISLAALRELPVWTPTARTQEGFIEAFEEARLMEEQIATLRQQQSTAEEKAFSAIGALPHARKASET